jgi:hypothetical protein
MPWREAAPLALPGHRRSTSPRGGSSPTNPVDLDQLAACLMRLARAFDRDSAGFPSAGLLLDERV